jgi:hypothetical protein
VKLSQAAVLRPGDWVAYDGGEHQVVALAGTSVRLRSGDGAEQVMLGGHLMGSPGFALIDGVPSPMVEPFGLLDSLPTAVLTRHASGSATLWKSKPGDARVSARCGTPPRL